MKPRPLGAYTCIRRGMGWPRLEPKTARAKLRPRWQTKKAYDLLSGSEVSIVESAFELEIPSWEVAVIHCTE